MSHITSPAKHIFPSVYNLQMPTAASLSTRRRPVIDLSQDTLQGHPGRSDSVRTFVYSEPLPISEFYSKLTSESSTCSTLVDNVVSAVLVWLALIELISSQEASMPVYLGDEHVMMHLDYMLVGQSSPT